MKRKQTETSAPQTVERHGEPQTAEHRKLSLAAEKVLQIETRHLIAKYVELMTLGSGYESDPDFIAFVEKQLRADLLVSGIPLTRKTVRAFVEERLFEMRDLRQETTKQSSKPRKVWIQYPLNALTRAVH